MKKEKKDIFLIQTILISAITATIIFGYFIIKNKGFFTVVDDFNEQQLPFATAVWNMIHSGNIGQWSWNIDLGSSFINTFSFYDLGSPFIWLSLLAPRGAFPYVAGILYIIKYTTAATTAYLYLKLFIDKKQWGVIGALIYAFSGFQTVNLEFFHFHDVVAIFPLLLLGLELFMKDKKYRTFFMFAIFANCLLNYFFFVGEVIFLAIYYLVRYKNLPVRQFILGILSCILCGIVGVGMAAVLFLPNILYVLGNSRSQSKLYLENLTYGSVEFLYIIKGILFPGEPMREMSAVVRQNWSSTSAYLPVFGISLAIAYLKGKKKTWLSTMLWVLGAIALFPLSESIFLLFSEANQRWWYMFVLMLAIATTKVLENTEEYPVIKSSILYCGILTIFYLAIRFLKWNANGDSVLFDIQRFTTFYLIALVGSIVFILLKIRKQNSYKAILMLTMCGCIFTTGITLHFYQSANSNLEDYKARFEAGMQLEVLDAQYRYDSMDNVLMINGNASGIGVFCTTIENSSRKFDTLFDNYSNNETSKRYNVPGLVELLAGRYEITREPENKEVIDSVAGGDTIFYITEKNACPIGFAVDYIITEEEFMAIPQEKKALTLMQAAIVDADKVSILEDSAIHVEQECLDYDGGIDNLIKKTIENKVFEFHRNSHGFNCKTDYDKNRLVYFTVPWSEGWEATVDGKVVNVIDSGGMMALSVPAGEHQVVFTYHTPGFRLGVMTSLGSFGIFITICIIQYKKRKKGALKNEYKIVHSNSVL